MTIKAIETVYNGYRFRSRLEARWAVFFDTLGVEYEYEPEGFDLGEHGWYLPDFIFPKWNVYVEIKPYSVLKSKEVCKPAVLSENQKMLAVVGNPWPSKYRLFFWEHGDLMLPSRPITDTVWAWSACNATWLCEVINQEAMQINMIFLDKPCGMAGCHSVIYTRPAETMDENPLGRAFIAARQARFEHGANGHRS